MSAYHSKRERFRPVSPAALSGGNRSDSLVKGEHSYSAKLMQNNILVHVHTPVFVSHVAISKQYAVL